jgi:glutathione S-transferase
LEQTWSGRSDAQRNTAWVNRHMGKVHSALSAMSKGLGDKPWCAGNSTHITLADVAVGCALGYLDFRFPSVKWRQEHTNLARLADKLLARSSFVDTAPPNA